MPGHDRHRPAPMSDAEAEALRLKLLEIIPRLRRHHLLEFADTLHETARERRASDDGPRRTLLI